MEIYQRESNTSINKIYFWTATIHKWLAFLKNDFNKQLIVESLNMTNIVRETQIKANNKIMKKLLIIIIASFVLCNCLYAQTKIINGRVISNRFDNLAAVMIMINERVEVGRTDLNGFFHIEVPDSINKLVFIGGGIESAIIENLDTCNEIEIIMMLSGTYDFITLKKVDRIRKKKFKRLPNVHKEAFSKGIFKTEKACYKREFIHYYKKRKN